MELDWATIILGIFTALFGTGFVATMVKIFVIDKKKSDSDIQIATAKNDEEVKDAKLLKISKETKLINDLLEDTNRNADYARKLQTEQNKLLIDNQNLKTEIEGKQAVIDYQKDERKDWMEMLKSTLQQSAEMKREFADLMIKVTSLEESEKHCRENVNSLEGRLNLLVGILQKNNLEMPEGFVWTNQQV